MNIFRRLILALVALATGPLANGGHSACESTSGT